MHFSPMHKEKHGQKSNQRMVGYIDPFRLSTVDSNFEPKSQKGFNMTNKRLERNTEV